MATRSASPQVLEALDALESRQAWPGPRRVRVASVTLAVIAFYAVCAVLAQVDLARLATGLPKLGQTAHLCKRRLRNDPHAR